MFEGVQLQLYFLLSFFRTGLLHHYILASEGIGLLLYYGEALLNFVASCDESFTLVELVGVVFLNEFQINFLYLSNLIDDPLDFKGATRLTFVSEFGLYNMEARLTSYSSLLHIARDFRDFHLLLDLLPHFLLN